MLSLAVAAVAGFIGYSGPVAGLSLNTWHNAVGLMSMLAFGLFAWVLLYRQTSFPNVATS